MPAPWPALTNIRSGRVDVGAAATGAGEISTCRFREIISAKLTNGFALVLLCETVRNEATNHSQGFRSFFRLLLGHIMK